MAYLGKLWGGSVFYQNTHSGLKLQHKKEFNFIIIKHSAHREQ